MMLTLNSLRAWAAQKLKNVFRFLAVVKFIHTVYLTIPAKPLAEAQIGGLLVDGFQSSQQKNFLCCLTKERLCAIFTSTKPAKPLVEAQIGGSLFVRRWL